MLKYDFIIVLFPDRLSSLCIAFSTKSDPCWGFVGSWTETRFHIYCPHKQSSTTTHTHTYNPPPPPPPHTHTHTHTHTYTHTHPHPHHLPSSFSHSGGVLCGAGRDGHGKNLWNTSQVATRGEVSVLARAHTDASIDRMRITAFDDSR